MNNTYTRIGESASLIMLTLLLLLLLNPFEFWMPGMMEHMLIGITFVVFLAVLLFGIGQHVRDERELVHRMFSDRAALIVGASILMISIILCSIFRIPKDPWIIISLGSMALAKYIALTYVRWYK
jgi:hypothetical protein